MKKLQSVFTPILIVIILALATFIILKGVEFFIDFFTPILLVVAPVVICVCVLIFFPLSYVHKTRDFCCAAISFCSYVLGAALWGCAAAVCLNWSVIAFIVGVLLLGFGVTPIALVYSLAVGDWLYFGVMLGLTVFALAMRFFSDWQSQRPLYQAQPKKPIMNNSDSPSSEPIECVDGETTKPKPAQNRVSPLTIVGTLTLAAVAIFAIMRVEAVADAPAPQRAASQATPAPAYEPLESAPMIAPPEIPTATPPEPTPEPDNTFGLTYPEFIERVSRYYPEHNLPEKFEVSDPGVAVGILDNLVFEYRADEFGKLAFITFYLDCKDIASLSDSERARLNALCENAILALNPQGAEEVSTRYREIRDEVWTMYENGDVYEKSEDHNGFLIREKIGEYYYSYIIVSIDNTSRGLAGLAVSSYETLSD